MGWLPGVAVSYCNATFDSYLCWPPTPVGEVVHKHCPPARLSNVKLFAFRQCGFNGLWLTRKVNESSSIGWTNYTPCFPPDVQTLFDQVYDSEEEAQQKFYIAQITRNIELVGFTVSFISLCLSLMIFTTHRSLQNNRTRIHIHLFFALLLQVAIRLILYVDQIRVRSLLGDMIPTENDYVAGIDTMPYVCESSYVLLEYANSVMFTCMLLEGLYLNNVVTANALRNRFSPRFNCIVGWGVPFVLTVIWAAITSYTYTGDTVKSCWYGYNFSYIYWILQGPRLFVCLCNFIFMISIMRVIIKKLRQSTDSELVRAQKATRATLLLLPLLGTTNVLNMLQIPLNSNVTLFAAWSYITHFLRSFQSFFIAVLYCFMNSEVQEVLKKDYRDRQAMRATARRRERRYRDYFFNFVMDQPKRTQPGPPPAASEKHPLSTYRVDMSGENDEKTTRWMMLRKLQIKRDESLDKLESLEAQVEAQLETPFGPDDSPEEINDGFDTRPVTPESDVSNEDRIEKVVIEHDPKHPPRSRSPPPPPKIIIFKDAGDDGPVIGPIIDDPNYNPDDPDLDDVGPMLSLTTEEPYRNDKTIHHDPRTRSQVP
ncbi:PDF receptor-like [Pectinophora gossypiella]|uniref:PDF receptor-like n=1 Tax=Pectinophora gossypiella TaxID=13191 RepID=UPI00214F1B0C|nr:PDF receptor-like [Pectinophora gossypiella]